ncbi:MAG: hypothetical protein ACLQVY_11610 [Limisphaerales bacterium]
MNILRKALVAAACAALISTSGNLMAQGRGNFDPAQMKENRLTSLREQMEIKDDAEWGAIQGKLSKVYDARASVMASVMRGAFGRGGRRNNNGNADDQAQQRPRRQGMFGEPSPAYEALQKAVEDKAPAAEVKTKLAAYRAEVKDRQAQLQAAEEDLRSVLTSRQEAIATLNGFLQ